MKFAVVVFPGSNCDADCHYVIERILGAPVEYVWFRESLPKDITAVVLPGGFAYGDYLRVGGLAKFAPVMKSVRELAERGNPVIGICNGFQVLLEAGMLPGAMIRNTCLHFLCRDVYLKTERKDTVFSDGLPDVVKMPIAHGEGNYFTTPDGLKELEDSRRILFRYCHSDGEVDDASNPNGSVGNIAGILNESGNVLGMMPHPERASEAELGGVDGRGVWEAMVAAAV